MDVCFISFNSSFNHLSRNSSSAIVLKAIISQDIKCNVTAVHCSWAALASKRENININELKCTLALNLQVLILSFVSSLSGFRKTNSPDLIVGMIVVQYQVTFTY